VWAGGGPPRSVLDPGKSLLNLEVATALGGGCAANAVLRAQPRVFGPVASDPTVSRTIDRQAHRHSAYTLSLELALGASTVAVGWSTYFADLMKSAGITIPDWAWLATPASGVESVSPR
jgi:hypothetical protein